jgi:hypothetical protein
MNKLLLIPLLMLVSCSSVRFSESDFKWGNSFKTNYKDLFLINDSIIYGARGSENYLIDSCTGKVLGLIAEEIVKPFYPKFGEKKYIESVDVERNRIIRILKSPFDFYYNVEVIDYNRHTRWQTYDKTNLVVTRKSDNKKKKIKFKTSIFSGIYIVIPYGKNELLIKYATRNSEREQKIGMIDLDKLFDK